MCLHVFVCVCVNMHVCAFACVYVNIRVCVCMCVYMCACVRLRVCSEGGWVDFYFVLVQCVYF